MNEGEAETYENLFQRIRADVEQAEKEIHETKIELEKARKIRRNRMEYDALAKVIFVSYYNMCRLCVRNIVVFLYLHYFSTICFDL